MTDFGRHQWISLAALVIAVSGCGGQGGAGGGGGSSTTQTQNDPLEGCPKGASDEFKQAYAEQIRAGRYLHEQWSRWRSEDKSETILRHSVAQAREDRESVADKMKDLKYDHARGTVAGINYVLRYIWKKSY
jgi:hypothetical protein